MIDPRNWDSSTDRALSEVTGHALLIGIVVIGVGGLLLVGGDVIDRHQEEAALSQAEHSLMQFDSEASEVAFGQSDTKEVDLGMRNSRGSLDVDGESGWIRVEVQYANHSTRTVHEPTVVVNRTLGAVTYQTSDSSVAYQGGGVWRTDGDGAVMRSRPEIQMQNNTLSMSIIGVERGGPVHNHMAVTRHDDSVDRFPDSAHDLSNKLEDSRVVVTVQSEYYLAWGSYFEQDMNAVVHYDHEREQIHVEFLALPSHFSPRGGVIATAGPGSISLHGSGSYVTSYDSRVPGSSDLGESEVESVGDVDMWGSAEIAGDVWTGSEFEIHSGSAQVSGDVYWTDDYENHGTVTGTDHQIDGVPSVPPITPYVESRVGELRAQNDNSETDLIDENTLTLGERDDGTLEAGEYYFEEMHIEERASLELDTTDGNITIGVRDWIGLESRASLEIIDEGDGEVDIFVLGETKILNDDRITGAGDHVPPEHVPEDDVKWAVFTDRGSSVTIPNSDATRLTVWGPDDFTMGVGGPDVGGQDSYFTGFIYAPAGEYGHGYVFVKQAHIYGAVVTGDLTIDQNGEIHYDHALEDKELPLAPMQPNLEYLYVTEHSIDVRER